VFSGFSWLAYIDYSGLELAAEVMLILFHPHRRTDGIAEPPVAKTAGILAAHSGMRYRGIRVSTRRRVIQSG